MANFVVGWLAYGAGGNGPWADLEDAYWRVGTAVSQWLLVANLAASLGCFAAAIDAAPDGFCDDYDDGAGRGSGTGAGAVCAVDLELAPTSRSVDTLANLPRAPSARERDAAVAALAAMAAGGAVAAAGVAKDRAALQRACADAGLAAAHYAK
jgi:hypothetical protein